jgi:pseudomonalisin
MERMNLAIAGRRAAAVTAAVAAVGAAVFGHQGLSAAAAQPMSVLSADVMAGVAQLHPDGPTAPQRTIEIGVALQRANPAAESAFVHDLYNPSSPRYHQFLNPTELSSLFGVPQARLDAVSAWLTGGGLSTQGIPGTTDYELASGTVAQVEALFNTPIDDFTVKGVHFYANTLAPSVPTSLGISTVVGLNNLEGPRLFRNQASGSTKRTSAPSAPPLCPPTNPLGNNCLDTPQVLWDVYQQPADNLGQGQSMAIFGWGTTTGVERDLRFFEQIHQFPAVPMTIKYSGTETPTDTTGATEWRLDTQASTGMAPDVTSETLYFGAAGTDADLVAAYKHWVNDASGPLQGSSSFGGCEEAPATALLPSNSNVPLTISNPNQGLYEAALTDAVAEGRTMFASTGDTGASCPVIAVGVNGLGNEAVPLLNYPAASPHVVAVGGTVLFWNTPATTGAPNTRSMEYNWQYSGGGSSAFLAAGDYQTSMPAPGLLVQCVSDPSGNPIVPPVPCRGIPDVAAQSGDVATGNGYSIVVGGNDGAQGAGTSLSSPLWLGMWTRIQAASPARSSSGALIGNGFADPVIYTAAANDANAFFDIGGTSTTTAVQCNGPVPPLDCSHPGWDYTAGWGTPNVTTLLKDIDKTTSTAPINPTTPAPVVTTVPPVLNPCAPLWTGPDGADNFLGQQGQNPQMDLEQGTIALSADGTAVITTLQLQDLSKTIPTGGGGNTYYMVWSYKGTSYFSSVSVDNTGAVAYGDGTLSGSQYTNRSDSTGVAASDQGTFNPGKHGTVTVTVPLQFVGNAKAGDILGSPTGQTFELVGTPQTGGLLEPVNQGGPQYDYQVGQVCNSPVVPEAPLSGLLVLGGGATIAGAYLLRRRRETRPPKRSIH